MSNPDRERPKIPDGLSYTDALAWLNQNYPVVPGGGYE